MTELAPEPKAPTYVQVALNLPLRSEFTFALPPSVSAASGNRMREHTDLPRAKMKLIDVMFDTWMKDRLEMCAKASQFDLIHTLSPIGVRGGGRVMTRSHAEAVGIHQFGRGELESVP